MHISVERTNGIRDRFQVYEVARNKRHICTVGSADQVRRLLGLLGVPTAQIAEWHPTRRMVFTTEQETDDG